MTPFQWIALSALGTLLVWEFYRLRAQALGRGFAYARLQLISTVLVVIAAAVVPVGESTINGLVPVAVGYIAVQVICAAAVLWAPARRRPMDVEVVSP